VGIVGKGKKKNEPQIAQIGTDLLAAEAPSLRTKWKRSAALVPRWLHAVIRHSLDD